MFSNGWHFRENFVQTVTKTNRSELVHIFRIFSLWNECNKSVVSGVG